MESDRPTSNQAPERPVTRWRRIQEDFARGSNKSERPSTGMTRPQSKLERPTSRRGIKDDASSSGTTYQRAPTPGRNALARPPTGMMLNNRAPTAGARLTTMSSARLSTGLSTSGQMNMSVLDRPITQQGIAGVRPGTTRGLPMTRQIQDKRYYEGLLQLKIRELSQEIGIIMRDIDVQMKERATFLHYDKRAKDLAAELTALQGELADYNIVVDKMTSDIDKETIEQEARELARMNERSSIELERMFEQRRQMEQQLRKAENELETERKSTERLIESMDPTTRKRYDELYKQKTELQEQENKMQKELDELSKEQARMEEQIALSQLKQEAVKLHVKLLDAEEKREKLREELRTQLSPEEEREQLLQRVKQDNMEIAAAEAQLAEKKKRIVELEQDLEQLETDLEDTQSDKQVKYKELRKREETMEQFMSTFERNKQEELEKLEKLEKSIVENLEVISSGAEVDTYLTAGDEIAILQGKPPYDDYEHTNHDRSFESLSKEYTKLQNSLTKMEMLEERLKSESTELAKKIDKREAELINLEDVDSLKAKSELQKEELSAECERLKSEQSACEKQLKIIQKEYKEMKERLGKNELYNQISSLENRLEKLKEENKKIENSISKQKERIDCGKLKESAFKLMNDYTAILKETAKSIYSF